MIRELKDAYTYPSTITFFSILSVVFCSATCFLGELFIPLAASFLAALFLFEKPQKRILSYICPAVSLLISVFLKGAAALITIECIILAVIIVFCYNKSLSKAEASIYLTLVISVFVLLSLYLSASVAIGSFSLSAVKEHYLSILMDFKEEFVNVLSQFMITTEEGNTEYAMSVENAQLIFKALFDIAVAMIAIFAFIITGLTLKLYTHLVLKYSKHGILKRFSHFLPSELCAYLYVISSLLEIFSVEGTKFATVLININAIMMVVFAYMGLKYLFVVAKISPRKSMVYFLIALGLISFPSVAPQVISYLGVWVVIGTHKHAKASLQ